MLDLPIHTDVGNQRIVLLHGFTQCGLVWSDVADEISRLGYSVSAPDLPGHGPNPAYDGVSLQESARLVTETCGPGIYVGYSLGARVLLHALADVQAGILVGPRWAHDQPAIRRDEDDQKAKLIETDLHQFLSDWTNLPFNKRVPPRRQYLDLRRQNRAEGLAASLRFCGLGTQTIETIPDTPVLVVNGEFDMDAAIDDAAYLHSLSARAQRSVVAGVGHAVPFELEPAQFAQLVHDYASTLI